METFNLLDSISTERLYLTLTGFYPGELEYKHLYYLSAFIHLSISWLQFLSLVTFSYLNSTDVTKISETLLFCMTQFAFLNKLTNLMCRKGYLRKLEELLKNDILTNVSSEERRILETHVAQGKLLAKIFRVLCFLVVLFYALFPFLDNSLEKVHKFPLPCWFPFDENKYYYPVFSVEIWSVAVSAFVNSSIDILTIMAMILATAEFEILRRKLTNIIGTSTSMVGFCDGVLVRRRLKECVIQYDSILYLVAHIEATFSKGIFIQFFCSVIVICLTGFQMLVISFSSTQFVLLVVYFSCMMCQVAMYCWFGHNLMDSSNKISTACYMSRWDKCRVDIRKSLVLVMERAKKPAIIKAAGFFTLNIPTLMAGRSLVIISRLLSMMMPYTSDASAKKQRPNYISLLHGNCCRTKFCCIKILRSSYSYFAVLQRLYRNEN